MRDFATMLKDDELECALVSSQDHCDYSQTGDGEPRCGLSSLEQDARLVGEIFV